MFSLRLIRVDYRNRGIKDTKDEKDLKALQFMSAVFGRMSIPEAPALYFFLPITHHPSSITHHPLPITHYPSPINHQPLTDN
jgi:hypothetical protein